MKWLLFFLAPVAAFASLPGNFDGWQVKGPGKVLGTSNGALCVQYDSPRFEPVILQPARPLPLPEGASQVRFWCARMAGDFDVRILVRDANGAEHSADVLNSRPAFPGIRRSKMKDWSVWHQVESVSLVAKIGRASCRERV